MGILSQDINTFNEATEQWSKETNVKFDVNCGSIYLPHELKLKLGIINIGRFQLDMGMTRNVSGFIYLSEIISKADSYEVFIDRMNNSNKSNCCFEIIFQDCFQNQNIKRIFHNAMFTNVDHIKPFVLNDVEPGLQGPNPPIQLTMTDCPQYTYEWDAEIKYDCLDFLFS